MFPNSPVYSQNIRNSYWKVNYMKKTLKITALALSSVFTTQSFAANYWVSIKAPTKEARTKFASFIHIDAIEQDTIYSVVNEWAYEKIQREHKKELLNSYKIKESANNKSTDERFPRGDEAYHTYDQMAEMLKDLAAKYPKYASVGTLGKSVEGREIYSLTLTDSSNLNTNSFIPAIAYLGSHHAREHLSTEVPLLAAKSILENLEKDPSLKELLSNRKLIFVPMVNPDGAMHDIKGGAYKHWRKNRSAQNGAIGVDLNRNYDNLWGRSGSSTNPRSDTFQGPTPFSEPETIAVKHFVESTPELLGMISFHTYGSLVLHPWGGTYDSVGGVDQKIFEKHGKEMGRLTGYRSQQSSDLYASSGDTCDWAYENSGVYCYTIELAGRSFYPGASIIENEVRSNTNAMIYLAKNISKNL
jgi:carboxypeptidase T